MEKAMPNVVNFPVSKKMLEQIEVPSVVPVSSELPPGPTDADETYEEPQAALIERIRALGKK